MKADPLPWGANGNYAPTRCHLGPAPSKKKRMFLKYNLKAFNYNVENLQPVLETLRCPNSQRIDPRDSSEGSNDDSTDGEDSDIDLGVDSDDDED